MSIDFIILSSGKGSRMKSSTPKSFHKIAGKPIIRYIIDFCKNSSCENNKNIIAIVKESYKNHEYFKDIKTVVQENPLGTADAVSKALPFINSEYTLILNGDMPLIEKEYILDLLLDKSSDALFIASILPEHLSNMPYGRVIYDNENNKNFQKIVEFKNASDLEKSCKLINTGIYKIKTDILKKYISKIEKNDITNEYYLTDILEIIKNEGYKISVIESKEYWPFHGINNMNDLAKAEKIIQNKLRNNFMKNGVNLIDPDSVYFSDDTTIENDVIIESNVIFNGKVNIKKGAIIKSFCYIEDSEILDNAIVGPFARIRNNSTLSENSEVGNFVEIKASNIKENSKIKHLSYIGDANIGVKTNIGAGTIICNYDGVKKHKTSIKDNVFVGSNTTIIAPLNIGDNSIIAAGSVITDDIPEKSLAISRTNQQIKINKSKEFWDKKRK